MSNPVIMETTVPEKKVLVDRHFSFYMHHCTQFHIWRMCVKSVLTNTSFLDDKLSDLDELILTFMNGGMADFQQTLQVEHDKRPK